MDGGSLSDCGDPGPVDQPAGFRALIGGKRSTVTASAATDQRGGSMATCEVCGNDYDKALQITRGGEQHTFDSFECAIHALAPTCDHCGCRIIGHGMEADGSIYCCAHCAREVGAEQLRDRV
jgi:hypothetical protein